MQNTRIRSTESTNLKAQYLHGYTLEEQQRLVYQAEFWKNKLILPGNNFPLTGKLLEIGCGVGACLAVIAESQPALHLSGLDISKEQLKYARHLLVDQKGIHAELKHGDAKELPWDSDIFDHVFIMWVLEHIENNAVVVQEAYRVLKPGGSITIIEADYRGFLAHPQHPDFDYLTEAQYRMFERAGNAEMGRKLGPLAMRCGFKEIDVTPYAFHYFDRNNKAFREHTHYVVTFLEGYLQTMADELGLDILRLKAGHQYLRDLHKISGSTFTNIIYKLKAVKELNNSQS